MNEYNNVLEFITTYETNDYIYQKDVKEKTELDTEAVYTTLEKIADEGVIKRLFSISCSKCGHEPRALYTSLIQLSDIDLVCDECKSELSMLDDITMVYMKL